MSTTDEDEQIELQEKEDEQSQLQERTEEKQEQQQQNEKEQLPHHQEKKIVSWEDTITLRSASPHPIVEEVWQLATGTEAPTNVRISYSDTSSSGSDVDPQKKYCQVAIIDNTPVGYNTRERMTLCYQLRSIAQTASHVESRLSGYNHRFANLELQNYTLSHKVTTLEKEVNSLEDSLTLQALDLILQKSLLEYHEHSRTSLSTLLSFTNQQLTKANVDLSKANITILTLQNLVTELRQDLTPWE